MQYENKRIKVDFYRHQSNFLLSLNALYPHLNKSRLIFALTALLDIPLNVHFYAIGRMPLGC